MRTRLVCYACGASYSFDERKRCRCGEPLWFDVDASAADWEDPPDADGIWRYRPFLPVDEPLGIAAAAGGTPLLRTRRLDEFAGCRTHVKDEGEHPTGSFKDRGSAVGVTYAARAGRGAVGTVSHGNMAMSVAAHAAATGLECAVLVPEDIPPSRLRIIERYGPQVLRVRGDYGHLYHDSLALGPRHGIEFVNSDTPLRVAGQKTTAFEVVEAFLPEVPDALVLPASSGGHASAVWKAFRDLERAGVLPAVPRLCLVQAAACAPIAAAFESGADDVTPTEAGRTVAYSIANPDPPSGTRALAAVRETGGCVTAVTDREIVDAKEAIATRTGLCVESASATALAGARKLAGEGVLAPDDRAVLVLTGTGFKEPPEDDDAVDVPAVPRDELDARLSDVAA